MEPIVTVIATNHGGPVIPLVAFRTDGIGPDRGCDGGREWRGEGNVIGGLDEPV